MTRLLALILIIVAASPSTATVIPADHLRPSSGNLSPSKGTSHRVSTVTVSTEVAGAVADGPGSTVPPGATNRVVIEAGLVAGARISALTAVKGWATWYDAPSRFDAAAGPDLRRAIGRDWRGSFVTVYAGERSAIVQLTDWCACGDRHGTPTVIDLDDRTFARLAPLGTGVLKVVVEWQSGPTPTAPPTDTEDPS